MNKMRQALARRARFMVAITATAALLGYTGSWHWLPELFSHFFIQYWIVCVFAGAVLFWAGDMRWGTASLALLSVLSLALAPYVPHPNAVAASASHAPLRTIQFNAAQNPTQVFDWLERHSGQVDLVILLEASPEFQDGIERLHDHFPYALTQLQHGPFGMALLSKYPLSHMEKLELTSESFPALASKVSIPGWATPLQVYAIHPPPPVSGELAALRMQYLNTLATLIGTRAPVGTRTPVPSIVLGDMNAAPWSPLFRGFERATGLRDCQRGHGLIATWPSATSEYSSLLGIPIDACLHSTILESVARQLGPKLGSDHLPVITELRLR